MDLNHALAARPEEPLVKPSPDSGKAIMLPETGGEDQFRLGRSWLVEAFALREGEGLTERLAEGLLAAKGGAEGERRLRLGSEVPGFARGADVPPKPPVGGEPRKPLHRFSIDADPAESLAGPIPRVPGLKRDRRVQHGIRFSLEHGRPDFRAAAGALSTGR
jgi:hypothetical protein